jgi:hypothetical protein
MSSAKIIPTTGITNVITRAENKKKVIPSLAPGNFN